MTLNPNNYTDFFKKIPMVFLIAIIFVIGVILFIPEELAKILAVDGFRKTFRVFLGPSLLLLIFLLIARLFLFFTEIYTKNKVLKNRFKLFQNLTPEEKEYLSEYVDKDKNSLIMPLEDGVIGGLETKGIVYIASNMGYLGGAFAFNLQPWALEYLKKNKKLLKGLLAN